MLIVVGQNLSDGAVKEDLLLIWVCYGQPVSPAGNIVPKSAWEEDKVQLDNLGNFNGSLCVPKFPKLYLDFFSAAALKSLMYRRSLGKLIYVCNAYVVALILF